ncbi:hypothetical protein THAOC_15982, partial [Thalassiosira oceanica]
MLTMRSSPTEGWGDALSSSADRSASRTRSETPSAEGRDDKGLLLMRRRLDRQLAFRWWKLDEMFRFTKSRCMTFSTAANIDDGAEGGILAGSTGCGSTSALRPSPNDYEDYDRGHAEPARHLTHFGRHRQELYPLIQSLPIGSSWRGRNLAYRRTTGMALLSGVDSATTETTMESSLLRRLAFSVEKPETTFEFFSDAIIGAAFLTTAVVAAKR